MEARVFLFFPIAVSPAPTTVSGTQEVLKHLMKDGQKVKGRKAPEAQRKRQRGVQPAESTDPGSLSLSPEPGSRQAGGAWPPGGEACKSVQADRKCWASRSHCRPPSGECKEENRAGSSDLSTMTFGAEKVFGGSVLCIIGLAASLASTHPMSVDPPNPQL